MAPRYLIIGASGFIGTHLYSALGRANAIPTYARRQVAEGIAFDARSMRLADTVLKKNRGLTHAFILHGITSIDACARDPAGTAQINVSGTQRVIDDLVEHGIVPVFAGSDAVFDGSRGLWSEEDPVNPILTYGRQKAQVERYLLEKTPSALVLRLAKVISAAPTANNLLGEWLKQLESGKPIHCASDQIFSPVTVDDAVDAFVRLPHAGLAGIVHVCGPRPVSRLQLLQTLVEEAGRYRKLAARIVPCSIRDFRDFAEARPFDTSMSPRKLYAALRRQFADPRETCQQLVAARHGERSAAQDQTRVRTL
jgi:dTDP-4-dehydrorhamnose reductase